jgi:3,4-dihydroxy 2-butanone 4-phosphate synthase / GTP cyclohydrolase II
MSVHPYPQNQFVFSPPQDIIEEARNGRMFILVDDETRENEGDLIIPAQMATPEVINFMAREGRGLICLPMEETLIDKLHLPQMANGRGFGTPRLGTAFTVSIEAREGVTTGISAADRARTIQVAIDPNTRPEDLVSPGHVFPLRAKNGGVLVRAGHTEAAVDIARLAGLRPAAVLCEIMKDDGTMARVPDLIPFTQKHNLKMGTIADLIAYRRETEKIVAFVAQSDFHVHGVGDFQLHIYKNIMTNLEHLALVKGDKKDFAAQSVLVRMHAVNVLNDLLMGSPTQTILSSLKSIEEKGQGVLVLIREQSNASFIEQFEGQAQQKQKALLIREYGVGAQILVDLGVKNMILLTNSPKFISGLDAYGLHIVGHQEIL